MWRGIDLATLAQPMRCSGYRVVEDQQYIAARCLVDSDEEHEVLEAMIEANKPPLPSDCTVNDYLLFTPFRYPPLLNGTRFGTAAERSPFYGARELETAFAEMAHMRFQFMADTTALLPSLSLRYTSFAFAAQASAALDLTQAPFAAHHPHILHPDDYIHSQELGTQMRQDNIEFCLFHSVRHETGVNICIFTPSVFTGKSTKHQHWVCFSDRSSVTFSKDKKVYYRFKAQDVYSK